MAKELLKDVTIRNTKPTEKDQRLNDGNGLYQRADRDITPDLRDALPPRQKAVTLHQ